MRAAARPTLASYRCDARTIIQKMVSTNYKPEVMPLFYKKTF